MKMIMKDEYSFEPIDVNKYGCRTYNYLLKQAKKNGINTRIVLEEREKALKDTQIEIRRFNRINTTIRKEDNEVVRESRESGESRESREFCNMSPKGNTLQNSEQKLAQSVGNDTMSKGVALLNSSYTNYSIDKRLNYALMKLGLEELIHIFQNNNLTFNDLMFLSKSDLSEMNFHVYQKNRILGFVKEYTKNARDYNMEEIEMFFKMNPHYDFTEQMKIEEKV